MGDGDGDGDGERLSIFSSRAFYYKRRGREDAP